MHGQDNMRATFPLMSFNMIKNDDKNRYKNGSSLKI